MLRHIPRRLLCLAALTSTGFISAADEPPAFKPEALILYQTPKVANARIATHVEAISTYVKALEAVAVEHIQKLPKGQGQTLLVIVVFKTDKTVEIRCTHGGEGITVESLAEMLKKMQRVATPGIGQTPLAFALHSSLWGGPEKKVTKPPYVPDELLFPKEWVAAAKKKGITLAIPLSDDDLRTVCPD